MLNSFLRMFLVACVVVPTLQAAAPSISNPLASDAMSPAALAGKALWFNRGLHDSDEKPNENVSFGLRVYGGNLKRDRKTGLFIPKDLVDPTLGERSLGYARNIGNQISQLGWKKAILFLGLTGYILYVLIEPPDTIIDPISLPSFSKNITGTGEGVRRLVFDDINDIQTEALTKNKINYFITKEDFMDVKIPITGWSYSTFVDITRRVLRREPTHLTVDITSSDTDGSVVSTEPKRFNVSVHWSTGGEAEGSITIPFIVNNTKTLASSIAETILHYKDPLVLADYFVANGRDQDAKRIIESITLTPSDRPLNYLLRGVAYSLLHQDDLSVEDYKQFIACSLPHAVFGRLLYWGMHLGRSPDREIAFAYSRIGVFYGVKHRYAKAEDFLRKGILFDPTSAELKLDLGDVLGDQGKYAEAKTQYRSALRLEPKYGQVIVSLSDLPKPEDQLDLFKTFVEKNPESAAGHSLYGTQLLKISGKQGEAVEEFKKVIALNPYDHLYWTDLGKALIKDGRFNEAIVVLLKADTMVRRLQGTIGSSLADFYLTIAYLKKGDVTEASSFLMAAIYSNVPNGEVADLGTLLIKNGRFKDAATLFDRAISAGKPNATNDFGLAEALYKSGQTGEAVEAYRRAVGRNPSVPDVKRLAYIDQLKSDGDSKVTVHSTFGSAMAFLFSAHYFMKGTPLNGAHILFNALAGKTLFVAGAIAIFYSLMLFIRESNTRASTESQKRFREDDARFSKAA